MASQVVRNFMKQQGFAEEPPATCDMHFTGLYFQPRIVFPLVLIGIVLHLAELITYSSALFFVLSAVLWWNVALPALNPFERFYNAVIAAPRGKTILPPAPGPRRFAQGMAAAFMLVVGVSLLQGWTIVAYVFEAGLVAAFSMLLFGKFCLGAYIYHLLRGEFAFANATLPWARPSN
ncbi:MAG TPA: DUF4395 family protein [Candidatus Acidoferrales bacterium]|nr:DUF4395 family protein [Candidatus Acidoferrales bacterium]